LQSFPQWASEYQWIMGMEETVLSRDEFEALKSLTNARYVEVATERWEQWFSALKLNRVDGLLQAADRAVMFGSEDSPITQLLSVLDVHMPLPRTINLSWYERFTNKIYEDWLNVQFQFGWRTTAAMDLRRPSGRTMLDARCGYAINSRLGSPG
jgi:hypothetical protein